MIFSTLLIVFVENIGIGLIFGMRFSADAKHNWYKNIAIVIHGDDVKL